MSDFTQMNELVQNIFELEFFNGELLFHNGRSFCPKARFYEFDSEKDVFETIVKERDGTMKQIYLSLLDCMFSDKEKYKKFKVLSNEEQTEILYLYSMKSWQYDTCKNDAFTLLNVNNKMYDILTRFGYIGSYYRGLNRNEGEIKSYIKS